MTDDELSAAFDRFLKGAGVLDLLRKFEKHIELQDAVIAAVRDYALSLPGGDENEYATLLDRALEQVAIASALTPEDLQEAKLRFARGRPQ